MIGKKKFNNLSDEVEELRFEMELLQAQMAGLLSNKEKDSGAVGGEKLDNCPECGFVGGRHHPLCNPKPKDSENGYQSIWGKRENKPKDKPDLEFFPNGSKTEAEIQKDKPSEGLEDVIKGSISDIIKIAHCSTDMDMAEVHRQFYQLCSKALVENLDAAIRSWICSKLDKVDYIAYEDNVKRVRLESVKKSLGVE